METFPFVYLKFNSFKSIKYDQLWHIVVMYCLNTSNGFFNYSWQIRLFYAPELERLSMQSATLRSESVVMS